MRSLLAFTALLLLSGCATIVNGSSQDLQFTSDPPGAQVVIDGKPVGVTPLTTRVHRHDPEVVLKKEGYEDRPVYLEYEISKLFWLDFFVFPVVGLLADTISDGMSVYEPALYHATLPPMQHTTAK